MGGENIRRFADKCTNKRRVPCSQFDLFPVLMLLFSKLITVFPFVFTSCLRIANNDSSRVGSESAVTLFVRFMFPFVCDLFEQYFRH